MEASKVLDHLVRMTVEALVLRKNAIREHRQKAFVVFSGFWALRGCGVWGLSESVQKGKFVTIIFFWDNDEVLIICEKNMSADIKANIKKQEIKDLVA